MGRKTWESLPMKPLPNRENIVLSKTLVAEVLTFKSYEECIKDLQKQNVSKVFIIGGRSMYQLFFDRADFLHITNIKLFEEGINEFFPIVNNEIVRRFKKIHKVELSQTAEYSLWRKIN